MKTEWSGDHSRVTASFEEIALSNMILVQALVELLAEKDILSGEEIKERVKKLKSEVTMNWKRPQ